jgi:hypothetical protein
MNVQEKEQARSQCECEPEDVDDREGRTLPKEAHRDN